MSVFSLEVTIIKEYNDTEESIDKIKRIISELSPDKIIVERMEDERFDEISKVLLNA